MVVSQQSRLLKVDRHVGTLFLAVHLEYLFFSHAAIELLLEIMNLDRVCLRYLNGLRAHERWLGGIALEHDEAEREAVLDAL